MENDLRVGDWLVQPQLNRIAGQGGESQLEPKVMEVLLRLAHRPGAVVSREELLSEVWPDTVVVETAVFRAISELRRALGDDPKRPRVIETVRKRGYRLIAAVERLDEAPGRREAPRAVAAKARRHERSRHRRVAVLGTLTLALAAMVAISFRATHVTVATRTPSWPAPPRLVASSTDLEFAPALSPDGRGLAYVRRSITTDGDELWKIYVKLPGDGTPRPLSPGTAGESPPAWSPGGDSIAFWRRADGADELAVVPLLGGPPKILARARVRADTSASWSDDGHRAAPQRRSGRR